MYIKGDIIDLRNLSKKMYAERFPEATGGTNRLFYVHIVGKDGFVDYSEDIELAAKSLKTTLEDSLPTEGYEDEIPSPLDNIITVKGEELTAHYLLDTLKYEKRTMGLLNTSVNIHFTYAGGKTHKINITDWNPFHLYTNEECQDLLERAIVEKDKI